tara:strand:+ start:2175 stop:3701 length:1527 start_codon:yes stop_codon:yes gene_type:complete
MNQKSIFKNLKSDLPASIVVFFVALPLCLGIALASGAPLFSGLIAGIIGGIIVGIISGSQVGVSGPAAGLAAIVFTAIGDLGCFQNFLLAVVLGGLIQFVFGILRAGVIGYYFPSSVIRGMLTGIGIIIIIKQVRHFFGYQSPGEEFPGILEASNYINPGATLIAIVSMGILLLWSNILSKKGKIFQLIQGPLVAVIIGIIYVFFTKGNNYWAIQSELLVSVPVPEDMNSFFGQFSFPNFQGITRVEVWITAFTIALVASLETLLCVEATDKLDPDKRITPTNRELIAQGTGNFISGLIGGLPVTQVIVRSSANIQSGGKTKMSAIIHGFFLLISVLLIPALLNQIPLSVLAAILFIVGYKLAKPSLFVTMYRLGWKQLLPFLITIIGIVFTDLLIGIGLGLILGILIILINSFQNSHSISQEGKNKIRITLAEEVTFFNKASILKELNKLPEAASLEIDLRGAKFIDNDIIEIFEDFLANQKNKNFEFKIILEKGEYKNPENLAELF